MQGGNRTRDRVLLLQELRRRARERPRLDRASWNMFPAFTDLALAHERYILSLLSDASHVEPALERHPPNYTHLLCLTLY